MESTLTFFDKGDCITDEMEFEITYILKQYPSIKWKNLKDITKIFNEKYGKQWHIFCFKNDGYAFYFISKDEVEDKEYSGNYIRFTQGNNLIVIFKT
jgi:hypothetical protein